MVRFSSDASYLTMPYAKKPVPPKQERISKSRAAKASFMTGFTVVVFLVWLYHLYWVIIAINDRKFGGLLWSLLVTVGSLALSSFIMIRVLLFFETRLLSDDIDADHKKYL